MTTDHLLSLRYARTWKYPINEGDKPVYSSGDYGICYYIDHDILRKELSKREHRVRAKDRRKPKKP